MGDPSVTYGPFGLRWGFAGLTVLAVGVAVGTGFLLRGIRSGSSLRCARPVTARQVGGRSEARSIRCTIRRGSRRYTLYLDGVQGARIGRQHKSNSYNVYLTYANGRTQRVLPNGRAVQHRFGPTDKASAQDAVLRFERFLSDPGQQRLELELSPPGNTLFGFGLALVLLPLIGVYFLFHTLRAFTRFRIRPGPEPGTLLVHRFLLGVSRETRVLRVRDVTRIDVEWVGLDRLLRNLDIKIAQGGRIVLRDEADLVRQQLSRAPYPGKKQHEDTATALRDLLSLRN